jgi:DNA-binding NarL/FixJ family response regulator
LGADVLRVAIVEDHPLYRQGLIQTIEESPTLELAAATITIAEFEALDETFDVVILDLHLPDAAGAEAVTRVVARCPAVLVVSASDDRESVVEAISAGASGYLTKASDAAEVVQAATTVAGGEAYVSPKLAAYLLRDARNAGAEHEFALTDREREILSLLAQGEKDSEIAEQLYISIRTVRSHLDRIRDKTGRRRRADLTRLALEQRDTRTKRLH